MVAGPAAFRSAERPFAVAEPEHLLETAPAERLPQGPFLYWT